jgi:hypothetical protein
MQDTLFTEICRLNKVLKGIDRPYWITEGDNDRVLFRYHDGYKEQLQQRITELMQQWRQEHPYAVLNGVEQ